MKPGRTAVEMVWTVAPKVYTTAVNVLGYLAWECERRTVWRGVRRPLD